MKGQKSKFKGQRLKGRAVTFSLEENKLRLGPDFLHEIALYSPLLHDKLQILLVCHSLNAPGFQRVKMAILRVPADPDALAGFDREADLRESDEMPAVPLSRNNGNNAPARPMPRSDAAAAVAVPPQPSNGDRARAVPGLRKSTPARGVEALSPMERAHLASQRRNWLLIGLASIAVIQTPFVVMWALQARGTAETTGTVAVETAPAAIATEAGGETKPALGAIQIATEPAQVAVSVDGRPRGSSPITVPDLTAGTHMVSVRFASGTVERQIRVESGSTASLVISRPPPSGAASGWMTVGVPAPFQIFEDGRLIGTTDVDRLMMPAGRHSLEFVSDALGFRTQQTVTVNPGATATVRLDLPQATLSINAQPWAEVWIDDERIGETPLGNVPRSIGRHEIVFRHPTLGERKASVLVTLKEPARVSVDMRGGN